MYSFSYRLREHFDWALCSIYLILESWFFAHRPYFAIESTNAEKIRSFHFFMDSDQFLLLSVEVCFILEHSSRVFSNVKGFSYFWHCMFWKKHFFWWFADIFACIRITTSYCIFFSAHFLKRFSLLRRYLSTRITSRVDKKLKNTLHHPNNLNWFLKV